MMCSKGGAVVKCTVIIGKERDEEVIIYAREKTDLVTQIERLVEENAFDLVGYVDKSAVRLNLGEVQCFVVDNKVYAITQNEKYELKMRLWQVEERLPGNFVKINQSCIANIKHVKQFDASFSGTLRVIFDNGYSDYVSRRRMKNVKERMGL